MRRAAILAIAFVGSAWFTGYSPRLVCAQATEQAPGELKDPPLGVPGVSQQPEEHAEVEFLDPVQTTIQARHSTAVELHFHVADGLHINSHSPREKELIPTRLAVVEQDGLDVTAVDFPPGTNYSLALAPEKRLSVYTGDFTLRAHITARPGEHLLHAVLRYQACDVNSCMPPRTLPIEVGILAK